MQIDYDKVYKIVGCPYYILDLNKFTTNYHNLENKIKEYYPKFKIAYSYKTNYSPILCKTINDLTGYAEVVSKMELDLALKIGVDYKNIFFNGPYKDHSCISDFLFNEGNLNIDSIEEYNFIEKLVGKERKKIGIGIRVNFDIEDGIISRFGFDVNDLDINFLMKRINDNPYIKLLGIHCHFANRSLDCWKNKVNRMLDFINKFQISDSIQYLSLGGGLYGNMPHYLKNQFDTPIPTFDEYANIIGTALNYRFIQGKNTNQPLLILEPGSALVGDAMQFVAKVVSIKNVRGKYIATLNASMFNINPTRSDKNLPITRICSSYGSDVYYDNTDLAGYTCIESDYLFRGYKGNLKTGDLIVFDNVGSYSIVLKPPFICPNFPIISISETSKEIITHKNKETFEDIFNTFNFSYEH